MTRARSPFVIEVIGNRLESITKQMSAVIERTAYSSVVRESLDFSTALFDRDGYLVAQAENIPQHLGSMGMVLRDAVFPVYSPDSWTDGDQVAFNHPYFGGGHTPDIYLFSPIMVKNQLLGFSGSVCHHIDVGGASPGSLANNVTSLFQEGLLLPPVKLIRGGLWDDAMIRLIRANVRAPDLLMGDLESQVAANISAGTWVRDVVTHYGPETVMQAMQAWLTHTEQEVRQAIRDWPDGVYQGEGFLDDDGVRVGQRIRLAVSIQIAADRIIFDMRGSDDQALGPVNCVPAQVWSVAAYVTRCITNPHIPQNDGALRPIEVRLRPGSILAPTPPSPVGARFLTTMRLSDVALRALVGAHPAWMLAGGAANDCAVTLAGIDPRTGRYGVYYEINGGGTGARRGQDGADGIDMYVGNCMNAPVEAAEMEYPVRFLCYGLRENSGGRGTYRGGMGIRRDIRVEAEEMSLTLRSDAESTSPPGIDGGEEGLPGEKWVYTQGKWMRLYSKVTDKQLKRGDILSIRTPGGGGVGPPTDRDIQQQREDQAAGLYDAGTNDTVRADQRRS